MIGVARDSRDHTLREKVVPRVFVSLLQAKFDPEMSHFANYEVRVGASGPGVLKELSSSVLAVDRNLDVNSRFLTQSIEDKLSPERLLANLITLFGILALALAAVGIYSILAYGVSQRTGEIGVRMAIGAGTQDMVAMIAGETAWMVCAGLIAGVIGAWCLTRFVQNRLFGVTATDPAVAVTVMAILAVVWLAAAILPAIRASRIGPAIALRSE